MNRPPRTLKAAARPLPVRRRPDLQPVDCRFGSQTWAVIRDPLTGRVSRLPPEERFVWEHLDGQTDAASIADAYARRFAPGRVTAGQLRTLVARFHRLGLVTSTGPGAADTLDRRAARAARQRWLAVATGWLFLKFPGVDPTPVLRRLRPITGRLANRSVGLIWLAAVVASFSWLAIHATAYLGDVQDAASRSTPATWIALAVVLGLMKIAHELGHAVACDAAGARCETIGPMLMVGIPALYCDVTDAWRLPREIDRMGIAAAGVAAELTIAAAAVWVWWATAAGQIHQMALGIIAAGSATTVLFNANPLMRLDGYYLLSDATGQPNLASRSRRRLTAAINRLLTGMSPPDDAPAWLAGYAVASWVYRMMLFAAIGWSIHQWTRQTAAQPLGQVLLIAVVASLLIAPAKSLRSWVSRFRYRSRRGFSIRPWIIVMMVSVTMAIILLVPMPQRLTAEGLIHPDNASAVYVRTAGRLVSVEAVAGDRVEVGDGVATLDDPALQLRRVRVAGQLANQRAVLRSAELRLGGRRLAESQLPMLRAAETDLIERLAMIDEQIAALRLTAPAAGVVAVPPPGPIDRHPTDWLAAEDQPILSTSRIGSVLAAGTPVAIIAPSGAVTAVALVSQNEVQRIVAGATVRLIAQNDRWTTHHGRVVRIAGEPIKAIPVELRPLSRSMATAPTADGPAPRTPHYAVTIRLDTPARIDPTAGSPVRVAIDLPSANVLTRVIRIVQSNWRF